MLDFGLLVDAGSYAMANPWLTATAVASLGSAGLVIRYFVGRSVVKHAEHRAEPGLRDFRTSVTAYFVPMGRQMATGFSDLIELIRASDALRAEASSAAAEMKIPEPGHLESIPDLERDLETIRVGFVRIYASFVLAAVLNKAWALTKDQARYRRAVAVAAATRQPPPEPPSLTGMDRAFVGVLDGLKFVDLVATTGDVLPSSLESTLPDGGLAWLADASHVASDVLAILTIPGVPSMGIAVVREARMWWNGETSIRDALLEGIAPSVFKSGLATAGLAGDTACHGLTFGVLTATGYAAGTWIEQEVQKDAIRKNVLGLQPYVAQIQTRKQQAVVAINAAITANFRDFPADLRNSPDVAYQPGLRAFLDEVAREYGRDVQNVSTAATMQCDRIVQGLPPRSLLDRILGVYRSAAVAALYRQAAGATAASLAKDCHTFAELTRVDPGAAIAAVEALSLLVGGRAVGVIATLPHRVPDIARSYQESLECWQRRCGETWRKGTAEVSAVTTDEAANTRALEAQLGVLMEPFLRRIRASRKRLGLGPAKCP